MEQWFRQEFENGDDRRNFMWAISSTSRTAKPSPSRRLIYQPNKLVTTSENQQEQFEVERLPSVGYYQEGQALFSDKATLYSENTGEGLHFARSRASLADQGFVEGLTPGLPAEGYTGLTGQIILARRHAATTRFPLLQSAHYARRSLPLWDDTRSIPTRPTATRSRD